MKTQDGPRARLRHRIPTRLRQHWKLVAALAAAAVLVIAAFGDVRIRPYITGDTTVTASSVTENITGTVDLFDDSVAHDVSLEFDLVQYNDMISAYETSGDKDWITATVTIDGTVINDVGVRLKGNSTLMSLRGDDGFPGGGPGAGDGEWPDPPEGFEFPGGFTPPEGMGPQEGMAPPEGVGLPDRMTRPEDMEQPVATDGATNGPAPHGATGGGFPGGGPPALGGDVSADEPNTLPLLLKFDKYADGRAYQGLTELSVRPGSPVLNEAMALSLTGATDQPTQRFAYTVYSVNGGETATRLLLENPAPVYADSLFDSDGYLYKADSSSRLTYIDEDQSSYSGQFTQINSSDSGTLQPVIDLARWLDEATDEEFDAELADWVEVESLSRYLATQNLLVNTDDMTGPGQNYYLWYDLATKKFTVVSWDLNLSMMAGTDSGPHDSVSFGGAMGAPGGQGGPGGGTGPDGGLARPGTETVSAPAADDGDARGPGGPDGDGGFGGNQLAERFLDSDAFRTLYESDYWQLFDEMYASGLADQFLDGLATSVPTSDGLTAGALHEDVESMRRWISERVSALEGVRSS